MRDKWMNIGFEEDELKPYNEPLPDLSDQLRIGKLIVFLVMPSSYGFSLYFCLAYTQK